MNYYTYDNHVVIKRHKMIMCFSFLKVIFIFLVSFFLYYIATILQTQWSKASMIVVSIAFFIIFCLVHYGFFILTSLLIKYYNNVLIISDNTIVSIKCSLLLKDDVEVIDCYRITKVDAFTRWFLPNILSYWQIVIEQQQNDLKTFHYIPKPYKLLEIVKKQRQKLLDETNNTIFKKD